MDTAMVEEGSKFLEDRKTGMGEWKAEAGNPVRQRQQLGQSWKMQLQEKHI